MVVGGKLRKRPGTARPLLSVPNLFAGVGVIGVVKRGAVRLDRPGPKDCVIQDPFHAVAITSFLADPQKVARDLEMPVGSAGCLKTGMSQTQAIADISCSGL